MEQTQQTCGNCKDSRYFQEKVIHINGWRKQMVNIKCTGLASNRSTGFFQPPYFHMFLYTSLYNRTWWKIWMERSEKVGVLQGSVLALIMFLIYINDMTEGVYIYINLFVNDSKFLRKIRNHKDFEQFDKRK